MRYVYFVLFLMFSYSSFAASCRDILNNKFSWHDLDAIVRHNGDRPIAKILPLETSKASKKAKKEMSDLITAGGAGHFGDVVYYKKGNKEVWSREEVVVVTTPPKDKIYGQSFDEIFKELQKSNTPVVVDPNTSWQAAAAVYTSLPYSDQANSILFMGPTRSDLVFRHEFLHVKDFAVNTKEFLKEVPQMPQAIHDIVQKVKDKKELTWFESKRVNAAREIPRDIAEVRASEGSVMSLFSKRGFKEIIMTKKLASSLYLYFAEIINTGIRNTNLLYHSMWANPLDPSNIMVAIKVAGVGFVVYEVVGKDIIFLYHVYTADKE